MLEILNLEFMQRALIAGAVLAPLLSVLGSFATLRKMSFFADGVAHASLLGVALAIVVGITPFAGVLLAGLIFGILIFLLERYARLASDAVIGIIFTTGLALGIIVISLQPGYQPDLISFLFGNILAITWGNVWTILILSSIILSMVFLLFRQFSLLSLSEELAWTSGMNTKYLNLLFYVLLSLAVVLGVKLLGIILVSALLITPAVTSKFITRSFYSYVLYSVIFSLIAFVGGLLASYYFDLPSGASIVVSATSLFVVMFAVKKLFLNKK
jgi:zinc transport system permease protein